jgi:transcriptional regulator with XRE-family HTH domain
MSKGACDVGQLVTSEQIRAARMLLRWEQRDLAEASGVSLPAIKRIEATRGSLRAHARTAEALRAAFAAAGVELIDERGVIMRGEL